MDDNTSGLPDSKTPASKGVFELMAAHFRQVEVLVLTATTTIMPKTQHRRQSKGEKAPLRCFSASSDQSLSARLHCSVKSHGHEHPSARKDSAKQPGSIVSHG